MARGGHTRWKPGESGNASGRTKGTVLLQSKLRQELEAAAPEAIKKLLELAKKGNVIALRLVIEKLLPTPRSAPVSTPVQLEGTAIERAEQVVASMADGSLTLEEGAALMSAIANAQTIRDSSETQERLADIEAKLAALGGSGTAQPAALPRPRGGGSAS
jgi:hypothetical protein